MNKLTPKQKLKVLNALKLRIESDPYLQRLLDTGTKTKTRPSFSRKTKTMEPKQRLTAAQKLKVIEILKRKADPPS